MDTSNPALMNSQIQAKYQLASKELQNLYKRTTMIEPLLKVLESVYDEKENVGSVNTLTTSISDIRLLISDVRIALLNVKEKKSGPFQRIIKNRNEKEAYDNFETRMDRCIKVLEVAIIKAEQQAREKSKHRIQAMKNNKQKVKENVNKNHNKQHLMKSNAKDSTNNLTSTESFNLLDQKSYEPNENLTESITESLSKRFDFLNFDEEEKLKENAKNKNTTNTNNNKNYNKPQKYGENHEGNNHHNKEHKKESSTPNVTTSSTPVQNSTTTKATTVNVPTKEKPQASSQQSSSKPVVVAPPELPSKDNNNNGSSNNNINNTPKSSGVPEFLNLQQQGYSNYQNTMSPNMVATNGSQYQNMANPYMYSSMNNYNQGPTSSPSQANYFDSYNQPNQQYYNSLSRQQQQNQFTSQVPPQMYLNQNQELQQPPSQQILNSNYNGSPQLLQNNNYNSPNQQPQQSQQMYASMNSINMGNNSIMNQPQIQITQANNGTFSSPQLSIMNSPQINSNVSVDQNGSLYQPSIPVIPQVQDMSTNNKRLSNSQNQNMPNNVMASQKPSFSNGNSSNTLTNDYSLSLPQIPSSNTTTLLNSPLLSNNNTLSPKLSNQNMTTSTTTLMNTPSSTTSSNATPTTTTIPQNNTGDVNSSNAPGNEVDPLVNQKGLIPPTPYYAISTFIPRQPDELAIEQGDEIIIVQTFDDGWAFGRNSRTRMVGVLPMTFLGYNEAANNSYNDNSLPDRSSSRRI